MDNSILPFAELIATLDRKRVEELLKQYELQGDYNCTYSYYVIYCIIEWNFPKDFANRFNLHWSIISNNIIFYYDSGKIKHKIK